MTTAVLDMGRGPETIPAPAVTVSLRDTHRQWLTETREWLAPALSPGADFWDMWSVVRYINDRFDRQYRRQLAFAEGILPMLSPADALVLHSKAAELEEARRNLDRLGRLQGTSKLAAAACSHFLELLEAWLGELQWLTRGLTTAELSLRAQKALAQLKAAGAIRTNLESGP
jgi:hypothetical protein